MSESAEARPGSPDLAVRAEARLDLMEENLAEFWRNYDRTEVLARIVKRNSFFERRLRRDAAAEAETLRRRNRHLLDQNMQVIIVNSIETARRHR